MATVNSKQKKAKKFYFFPFLFSGFVFNKKKKHGNQLSLGKKPINYSQNVEFPLLISQYMFQISFFWKHLFCFGFVLNDVLVSWKRSLKA